MKWKYGFKRDSAKRYSTENPILKILRPGKSCLGERSFNKERRLPKIWGEDCQQPETFTRWSA